MRELKTRPSLRKAVDRHCRACIYDPSPCTRGTWREQVAACTSSHCPLFDVRPVPRDCVEHGAIDAAAISAIGAKLAMPQKRAQA
jgi:hypothetical protein